MGALTTVMGRPVGSNGTRAFAEPAVGRDCGPPPWKGRPWDGVLRPPRVVGVPSEGGRGGRVRGTEVGEVLVCPGEGTRDPLAWPCWLAKQIGWLGVSEWSAGVGATF
jgi:hypothetical protein